MHVKLSYSEAVEMCQRYMHYKLGHNVTDLEIEGPAAKSDTQKISPDALDQLWAKSVRPLDTAGELMPAKADLAKLYYNLRNTFTSQLDETTLSEARNFVVCHRHDIGE